MRLVGFHCHLDLYPDFAELVAESDRLGIFTLAVTTTPKAWSRNNMLASSTKYVRAALGIHPQLVAERWREINLWEKLLGETRYVGEVGLDASPRYLVDRPPDGSFSPRPALLLPGGWQDPVDTQRAGGDQGARFDRGRGPGGPREIRLPLVYGVGRGRKTGRKPRLLFLDKQSDAVDGSWPCAGLLPADRPPPHRNRWPVHIPRRRPRSAA